MDEEEAAGDSSYELQLRILKKQRNHESNANAEWKYTSQQVFYSPVINEKSFEQEQMKKMIQ